MRHSSLLAAFGIPHNPHFPTWVASGHPLAEEIEGRYRPLREAFERARPDTLVYITSDHYERLRPAAALGPALPGARPHDRRRAPA